MVTEWDVIVVGGGPAGSSAALSCASEGLKTLLLEKAALPRGKPCAGGVTAAAAKELLKLPSGARTGETGLEEPMPPGIVERECRGLRLIFGGVERTIFQDSAVAYTVRRERFDEHLVRLAQKSGADVREEAEVLSLEREGGRIAVRAAAGIERAPLVIGADGCFSRVGKFIGSGFGRNETLFCVVAELPLPEAEIDERFGDCLTVHYGLLDRGYGWIFPKRDHLSVGIGGGGTEARRIVSLFRPFITMHGLRHEGKVRGCYLPVFGSGRRSCADGVVLAGDAAGFVDAFTGEGIRYALASGRIAGAAAAACHRRGDFSAAALSVYGERCREEFGRDLRMSGRMTELAFRRKSIAFGVALGNRAALARYVKAVKGEIGLREFGGWVRGRMPFLLARSACLILRFLLSRKTHGVRGVG